MSENHLSSFEAFLKTQSFEALLNLFGYHKDCSNVDCASAIQEEVNLRQTLSGYRFT